MNKKIASFLTLCMYAPFVFCVDQDKNALLKKEVNSVYANTGKTNIPVDVLETMEWINIKFSPRFREKIFDNNGNLKDGHEQFVECYGNSSRKMMRAWSTAGFAAAFGSLFSGLTAMGMVDSVDEQDQTNSTALFGVSAVQLLLASIIATQAVPHYYKETVEIEHLSKKIKDSKSNNNLSVVENKEQKKQD